MSVSAMWVWTLECGSGSLHAPQRYLGSAANAAAYLTHVSYEDIAEWMLPHLPPGRRTELKRNLILNPIEIEAGSFSPRKRFDAAAQKGTLTGRWLTELRR